ncbi:MAG TPA: DUF58 domain-containing protein [Planctomycetota bacterium]|jgi:uncharacterized protein (DUF58 family)
MPFGPEFIRTLDALNLLARRLLSGEDRADRPTPRRGASLEFADYRRYTPGDEIRYIDWNVYARHGALFVKEFAAEENVHVTIILDTSASMAFGKASKFEAARELAAALGYIALANFDSVSVAAAGATLKIHVRHLRGKRSVFPLLAALEGLASGGRTDFKAVFAAPLERRKGRSLILLLTDFCDPAGYSTGIRSLLSQGHQVHMIHVVAREELEPPERGLFQLVDLETGERRTVPLSPGTVERYRDRFRAFCDEVERFSTEHELYYARIRSDEPLERRVRDILRRGGILAKK